MKKFKLLIMVLFLFISGCVPIKEMIAVELGNMKSFANDDIEMNSAIEQARKTLPLFISVFQNPGANQSLFTIKVKFPYGDAENNEHMWVDDLTYSNEIFHGTLGNEPVYIKDLHLGDTIDVSLDRISDWMFIEDGKLVGGFTIHAIRNSMTEKEKAKFDASLGFEISDEPLLP